MNRHELTCVRASRRLLDMNGHYRRKIVVVRLRKLIVVEASLGDVLDRSDVLNISRELPATRHPCHVLKYSWRIILINVHRSTNLILIIGIGCDKLFQIGWHIVRKICVVIELWLPCRIVPQLQEHTSRRFTDSIVLLRRANPEVIQIHVTNFSRGWGSSPVALLSVGMRCSVSCNWDDQSLSLGANAQALTSQELIQLCTPRLWIFAASFEGKKRSLVWVHHQL